jgi:hypothetical protein
MLVERPVAAEMGRSGSSTAQQSLPAAALGGGSAGMPHAPMLLADHTPYTLSAK